MHFHMKTRVSLKYFVNDCQIFSKKIWMDIKIILKNQLKKIGCLHQHFFYGFRVILIVSGCFQMDMDGSRPATAGFWLVEGGFGW